MACRLKMLALTDKNFENEVINSKIPVLVDFWAPWCGPCQMVDSIIEELSKEFEEKVKIGKLNVEESPQIAVRYGVMSIPTVIFFKEGKEVGRKIGLEGKDGLIRLIRQIGLI